MAEYDLIGKTELLIEGISLNNADLDRIARVAADTFGIARGDLLVTDVQGDHLAIDILREGLDPHALVGKRTELLDRLSRLSGVRVAEGASILSRGMLGWIAMEAAEGKKVLDSSERMAGEIRRRLKNTAVIFSTGSEMINGQVLDSNALTIRERLLSEGYSVKFGGTLGDDEDLIAARLSEAAGEGYGLILTTGGVGAEDKDRTIEAVCRVDPGASTPTVVKFQLGVGRHRHKDCVRVAVGCVAGTWIVALPGPNDEVRVGLDALVKGLGVRLAKEDLAESIAATLRARLAAKMSHRSPRKPGPCEEDRHMTRRRHHD